MQFSRSSPPSTDLHGLHGLQALPSAFLEAQAQAAKLGAEECTRISSAHVKEHPPSSASMACMTCATCMACMPSLWTPWRPRLWSSSKGLRSGLASNQPTNRSALPSTDMHGFLGFLDLHGLHRFQALSLDTSEAQAQVIKLGAEEWTRISSAHVKERSALDCRTHYMHLLRPRQAWMLVESGQLRGLAAKHDAHHVSHCAAIQAPSAMYFPLHVVLQLYTVLYSSASDVSCTASATTSIPYSACFCLFHTLFSVLQFVPYPIQNASVCYIPYSACFS